MSAGAINLVIVWLWIILGFVSGFVFGSYFHREEWLGGYTSFRRRLYRLAHISFFGMALINLMFYFTIQWIPAFDGMGSHLRLSFPIPAVAIPSWGFIIGAVSMPACCFAVAHHVKLRAIFLIPVASLLVSSAITLWEVIKL